MSVRKFFRLVTIGRILLGTQIHFENELSELSRLSVFCLSTLNSSSHTLWNFTKICDKFNLVKELQEQHSLYLKTYLFYIYEYSVL